MRLPKGEFEKDPDEVLDYTWNWGIPTDEDPEVWLADDETITAHTITVTDTDGGVEAIVNVAAHGVSVDLKNVTAWITGGTAGRVADVVCQVTTSAARQPVRRIRLHIKNR